MHNPLTPNKYDNSKFNHGVAFSTASHFDNEGKGVVYGCFMFLPPIWTVFFHPSHIGSLINTKLNPSCGQAGGSPLQTTKNVHVLKSIWWP